MIAARSSSLRRDQPAISGRVRRQPRQTPVAPSTAQTLTQGVAMARGGRAAELTVSRGVAEVMPRISPLEAGRARGGLAVRRRAPNFECVCIPTVPRRETTMHRLKIAFVAAVVASAAAPAFAADRLSDTDLLRASRCLGLGKAQALGAVDTTALESFVKAQRRGRDPGLRNRSDSVEKAARSQASTADGERKATLQAERDGVCKAMIDNPTGA